MDIFESVTCCVLALMTFAVFRKELLKVKDVLVSFWIPAKKHKTQKDSDKKNKRQESNKENIFPLYSSTVDSGVKSYSPLKNVENEAITKEIVSLKETTTKMTEETEGLRIKSATLLPDVISFPSQNSIQNSFENFTSKNFSEDISNTISELTQKDPFPLFSDIVPGDLTSTKTEEVHNDDNTFRKITTETKHGVQGNTETSFMKKEEESVSKKILTSDGVEASITNDAKDLNDLINATQKKLESFKTEIRTPTPDIGLSSKTYEIKKMEEVLSETKMTETLLNQIPIPDFDSIFNDTKVPTEKDLAAINGTLGYTTNSTESSSVAEETPFGSTIITKKKKMFSSSSFYEEPHSIYPTVEEQVKMAHKIAGSLADDTNQKSKGANMFFKRVKRSSKWIHEGPEPSDESAPTTPEIQGIEPPTPDPSQVPFKPSKGPPNLRLVMDSRHPLDLNALRSSGLEISEHNVISPEVCHGIVKDLQSPKGKGAALFAKRKKKSEEWVVDEEKVKAMLREKEQKSNFANFPLSYNQYSNYTRQEVKLIKSPWEAAMESPFGLVDAAFVHPDHLADTVIRAADTKRRNSITNTRPPWETSTAVEGCISPPVPITPAAAQYDIYHAKAPKGWLGSNTDSDYNLSFPTQSSVFSPSPLPDTQTSMTNNSMPRKINFQNFNTVPRLWRGASAH